MALSLCAVPSEAGRIQLGRARRRAASGATDSLTVATGAAIGAAIGSAAIWRGYPLSGYPAAAIGSGYQPRLSVPLSSAAAGAPTLSSAQLSARLSAKLSAKLPAKLPAPLSAPLSARLPARLSAPLSPARPSPCGARGGDLWRSCRRAICGAAIRALSAARLSAIGAVVASAACVRLPCARGYPAWLSGWSGDGGGTTPSATLPPRVAIVPTARARTSARMLGCALAACANASAASKAPTAPCTRRRASAAAGGARACAWPSANPPSRVMARLPRVHATPSAHAAASQPASSNTGAMAP